MLVAPLQEHTSGIGQLNYQSRLNQTGGTLCAPLLGISRYLGCAFGYGTNISDGS